MTSTILAAALFSFTSAASAAPTEALSVDETVSLADQRNPGIVALREALEELRGRVADPRVAEGERPRRQARPRTSRRGCVPPSLPLPRHDSSTRGCCSRQR